MLLIAFLLSGLLPALLVSVLSFYQARIALRTEIKHDLQTTGKAVAEHIDRILYERVQNVRSWSQLAIMQDMLIGDIDKRLSVFLHETRNSYAAQYIAIDVIDLQSVIVASSNPPRISQRLTSPTVWFSFTDNGQPITVYHLQNDQLMISAPIISSITLQPIGHLVATFNWSVIRDLLNHASQHATELALVDENKRLLAQSNNWSESRPSLHTHVPLENAFLVHDWGGKAEQGT